MTTEELRKLAEDAEKQAKELRRRVEAAENAERDAKLNTIKPLVKKAHDILCRWNHTDGCSWGYENDNWNGWAHARWLKHFDNIINPGKYSDKQPLSVEVIDKLLEIVVELKKIDKSALWILRDQLEP
jgi:hypothetical protein